jgi:hypothetical protein
MDTKHTPGPWRAGSGTGGKGSVVSDQLAAGALGGSDAVKYYGGHLIAESVAPENIPLIAAAPELLAALQAMLDNLRKGPFAFRDSDELRAARAAVAKATGSAA